MSRKYREVFLIYNGGGPWPCYFCEDDVVYEELLVHHIDGDHSNNTPTNLSAAHFPCHARHHIGCADDVFTVDHRRKLSEAATGRVLDAATRKKISQSRSGRPLSDAHREAISRAGKGRPKSQDHRSKIAEGMRRYHATH